MESDDARERRYRRILIMPSMVASCLGVVFAVTLAITDFPRYGDLLSGAFVLAFGMIMGLRLLCRPISYD